MGSCRLKHLQKTLASFAQHAQLAQRAACYLIWKALSGSVFMAILVVYTSNRYTFLLYEAASNWAMGIVLYSRRSTRLGRFILRPSTAAKTQRSLIFGLAWLRRRRPSSQRWHPRQEHNQDGKTDSLSFSKLNMKLAQQTLRHPCTRQDSSDLSVLAELATMARIKMPPDI